MLLFPTSLSFPPCWLVIKVWLWAILLRSGGEKRGKIWLKTCLINTRDSLWKLAWTHTSRPARRNQNHTLTPWHPPIITSISTSASRMKKTAHLCCVVPYLVGHEKGKILKGEIKKVRMTKRAGEFAEEAVGSNLHLSYLITVRQDEQRWRRSGRRHKKQRYCAN